MAKPNLWGFKKLASKNYPIAGAQGSAAPAQVTFDLKDFLQHEVVARLFVRVRGNVIIAGAGPGAATGKENVAFAAETPLTFSLKAPVRI